jgi:hypothetical protein
MLFGWILACVCHSLAHELAITSVIKEGVIRNTIRAFQSVLQ